VPRRKTAVKTKSTKHAKKRTKLSSLITPGLIDIHFHGAFGIDLMTAEATQLDELAIRLKAKGIAAFCPTTLSSPHAKMLETVGRLGRWIGQKKASNQAIPLGLHLEGPYISGGACGAHPPSAIRKLSFPELEELWSESQHTIKILTVAPEELSPSDLKKLVEWCRTREIVLSLGHSKATEKQAFLAFNAGFRGVTHAWNAMSFHHRAPGVLGAAMRHPQVYLELIIDQIHVAPEVVRWTRSLHPADRLCLVSDCVPAAGTLEGSWHGFGALQIQFKDGAGRLRDGSLAGGGRLLSDLVALWVCDEALAIGSSPREVLKAAQTSFSRAQLLALGFTPQQSNALLKRTRIRWNPLPNGKLRYEVM
jgi:N-acetylglucosamine-6-phosphate deacetylase